MKQVSCLRHIKLSKKFVQTLENAHGLMTKNGDSYLAVDTYILANLKTEPIASILSKYIDVSELAKNLEASRGGAKIDSQSSDETLESLAKYGIDLTTEAAEGKLSPVIGRDEEISRMMQILIRKTKNNPMLLGEPGVGKTALVLPDSLLEQSNVQLSLVGPRGAFFKGSQGGSNFTAK